MKTYNNVIHNLRVQYVLCNNHLLYHNGNQWGYKLKTQNFDTKNYFLYKDHALLFINCLLYSKNLEATDFILLILKPVCKKLCRKTFNKWKSLWHIFMYLT